MASFNADGARRVARSTRRIEQTPRARARPPRGPRAAVEGTYAIVATAIGAAGSGTLGHGKVTLQEVTYADDDTATYTSSGITVPAYTGGDAIGLGRLVVVEFVNGRYSVTVDYC